MAINIDTYFLTASITFFVLSEQGNQRFELTTFNRILN